MSNTTNLDASAATGTSFTTPISVIDSQGTSHNILITYTKTANAGEWSAAVTTDGGAAFSGYPALLEFDSSGNLTSPTTNPTLTQTTAWSNGATSPAITVNLWSGTPPVSSLTSYAQNSATSNTTQNGYAAGTVSSMMVDQNGIIEATFTNGQTLPLAQVAVTSFANDNGLAETGSNLYSMTLASGAPNVGTANSGGRGTVLGANLESSNVDVATEFTQLIIDQNGYQANSRVITTANTLLQTLISMVQ